MSKTGVEVMTWGTGVYNEEESSHSGMNRLYKTLLWGGNVGHAAVKLTLPHTKENWKLVNDNLEDTDIPYQAKTYETKKVALKYDKDGKLQRNVTDEAAYKEDVIEIYFSYWPAEDGTFTFSKYSEDLKDERVGVHVEYNPQWQEYLNPEERRLTGGIASTLTKPKHITLDVDSLVHLASHNKMEQDVLIKYQKYQDFSKNYSAIKLAISKLSEKLQTLHEKQKMPLSDTEKKLVQQFLESENVSGKFSQEDIQGLIDKLSESQDKIVDNVIMHYYEYLQSLINLSGGFQAAKAEYVLTDDEKRALGEIDLLKDLSDVLSAIDLKNNKGLNKVNDIIKNHAAFKSGAIQKFKDGIKNEKEFEKLKTFILKKLDFSDENSLVSQYIQIDRKMDMQVFYNTMSNIQPLTLLKNKIEEYVSKIDPQEKRKTKLELNALIRSITTNAQSAAQQLCKQYANNFPELENGINEHLKEEMNSFREFVSSQEGKEVVNDLFQKKGEALLQNAISKGHPPSSVVILPLKNDQTHRAGLDPKAMIEAMVELINKAKAFNLLTNNCAVSCSQVLAAGAGDMHDIFEKRALAGKISNPQMVFNNAVEYSGTLSTINATAAAPKRKQSVRFSKTESQVVTPKTSVQEAPAEDAHQKPRRGA
ncbi:MAG: hypothetical protein JSS07_10565 [Proteobacteria bacterium]|nr:hypothetical protein [Pseudomonadota bacterium]